MPTRPRRLSKQECSKASVEAILEVTARVLGYEGTTTNRIAEASGYGVGSLYDYFPNGESLVAAFATLARRLVFSTRSCSCCTARVAWLAQARMLWAGGYEGDDH